ncbi:MAG: sulfotransferase family protein [Candidatus Hydrogenedentes bacterium]|nr:sulfotransferase family protein [Candidatus Hydrogenedentota bacterium]
MPTSESPDTPITVVSGLPRSGTSMMMKMLEAGGMDVLTDQIRTADDDNPKGYYEFERVKKITTDQAWLPEAQGKVVKIISFLLLKAPSDYRYKVVFMKRALPEILASQQQMLLRRGDNSPQDDVRMAELYEKHLNQACAWLEGQSNIDVLYVEHRRTLEFPLDVAKQVADFLGCGLDPVAMASEVDKSLHRQRA